MKLTFFIMFLFTVSCNSNSQNTLSESTNHLYTENETLNNEISVNATKISALQKLKDSKKFKVEKESDQLPIGYAGLLPQKNQPIANKLLNETISNLIQLLNNESKVSKRNILNEFEKGLNTLNEIASDTEDRERICYYFEDIMDIIGLDSSNDLLNNWMEM